MLRVVADTNIYISAMIFGGLPEKILILAKQGNFQLFISPAIFQEIEGVFAKKFAWDDIEIAPALKAIRQATRLVMPVSSPHIIVKKDPSDDRILECAIAAHAHIIVTGDSHLRAFHGLQGIEIIKPRDFLDSLQTSASPSNF